MIGVFSTILSTTCSACPLRLYLGQCTFSLLVRTCAVVSDFSCLCEAGRTNSKLLDPYWTLGCGGFPWLQKDSLEVVKDKQRRPARPVFKNPKTSETLCSAREASRFCMLLLLTNGEVRCSHSHSCCSLCINRLFGLGLMISVFLCFLTHNRSQTCDVVKISCSLESGKSRARSYHYLNGRFWTHFLMSLSLSFLISTIMLNLLTF